MAETKSNLQIALDSWQLFCWHHPWVKDVGKACCYALCCPYFACYRRSHTPRIGCVINRRMQNQRKASSKMFGLQIEKRQRQHKRRNSLTGDPSTTWKLGSNLKWRNRWCDQITSPLFLKLPPELRMKIYALVLNERNLLRVVPNEEKGKFRICSSSVYKDGDLNSEISSMMYETFHGLHGNTGWACRSQGSLLSLLLSCRRM
jgi:hypothetical protein